MGSATGKKETAKPLSPRGEGHRSGGRRGGNVKTQRSINVFYFGLLLECGGVGYNTQEGGKVLFFIYCKLLSSVKDSNEDSLTRYAVTETDEDSLT